MRTQHRLRLFDEVVRTDARPAQHDEPRFAFLNRASSPYWERVRDALEHWFSRVPSECQADIRGRFRSSDDRHNMSALWEVYVHEALRVEGFTLTPHPDMPSTTRRPDFLAVRSDVSMYVEATVSSASNEDTASARRIARMNEALNKVRAPNFFLWLDMYKEGGADPPVGKLRRDLEAWLATFDPDKVASDLTSATGLVADVMPQYRWQQDGWDIGIRAVPVKSEARGRPDHRPVGVTGPGRAAIVDAITPLRTTLEDKATCYGEMDRPYLIAVVCEAEMHTDDYDIEGALYGQEAVSFDRETLEATHIRRPDGFWTGRQGVRGRVSGVLTVWNIRPWTVHQAEPCLWHNPWADYPIPSGLPWASVKVDAKAGLMERAEPARPARQRFGLTPDWPGPGDPFPKNS
jgi:hypothetical protein